MTKPRNIVAEILSHIQGLLRRQVASESSIAALSAANASKIDDLVRRVELLEATARARASRNTKSKSATL